MSRNSVPTQRWPLGRRALSTGLLGVAVVTAGCSADVARFESPYFGLNGNPDATSSVGRDAQGSLSEQSPSYGGGGYAGAPARSGDVRVASLPDPAPTPYSEPISRSQPVAAPAAQPPAIRPAAAAAARPAPAAGQTIDVQQGDTLFAIARRHNVRVEDIKALNNLSTAMIRPGQRLVLPAGSSATAATTAARKVASAPSSPAAPAAPAQRTDAAAAPAADAPGTYTMRNGDSLYTVAKAQKVSLAELQRINNITDPARVRVGTVLKLRADATLPGAAPPAPAGRLPAEAVAAAEPAETSRPIASTTKPTIINGAAPAGPQVAAVDPRATLSDATPATPLPQAAAGTEVANAGGAAASAVPSLAFRWPAKGRVLSKFGPRPDGTSNDGVDIAVPLGTEVVAAEAGVVAYAGSELKGFGNLVLIRHEGGWVTAYAHNDELLVKRGDKIRRGQPIAKAGKSGNADQPMVHFEIRNGSKPVDPMPFLEKGGV